MPKFAKRTRYGYVISADAHILPDAINDIVTDEGATNYMQLKAISRSISFDIQGRERIPWPPTRKDMLESNEFLDLGKRLFNLTAWIVSPKIVLLDLITVNISEISRIYNRYFPVRNQVSIRYCYQ